MNILDKILKEKEFEVENLKKSFPLEQLQSGIIEKKQCIFQRLHIHQEGKHLFHKRRKDCFSTIPE